MCIIGLCSHGDLDLDLDLDPGEVLERKQRTVLIFIHDNHNSIAIFLFLPPRRGLAWARIWGRLLPPPSVRARRAPDPAVAPNPRPAAEFLQARSTPGSSPGQEGLRQGERCFDIVFMTPARRYGGGGGGGNGIAERAMYGAREPGSRGS
ncbi:hypothetical protein BUE80_DR005631 [Diplocarpon rosae]|nr:hypothetical protein BUE80_DR005631 [Diplocarpon rosae]